MAQAMATAKSFLLFFIVLNYICVQSSPGGRGLSNAKKRKGEGGKANGLLWSTIPVFSKSQLFFFFRESIPTPALPVSGFRVLSQPAHGRHPLTCYLKNFCKGTLFFRTFTLFDDFFWFAFTVTPSLRCAPVISSHALFRHWYSFHVVLFCQDFSRNFGHLNRLDRKSKGEICQFEGRDLANLSPQIAVKLGGVLNLLIINTLQKCQNIGKIVKIFHNFYPRSYR